MESGECYNVIKPNKDLKDPHNYRPISLLSLARKVFERLILQRINVFIEQNDCLQNTLFGFRSHHSTVHQLVRVTKHIQFGFDLKQSTGSILFDGEITFDTGWHDGLLHKLTSEVPILLDQNCTIILNKQKIPRQIQTSQIHRTIHSCWRSTRFLSLPHTVQYIYFRSP